MGFDLLEAEISDPKDGLEFHFGDPSHKIAKKMRKVNAQKERQRSMASKVAAHDEVVAARVSNITTKEGLAARVFENPTFEGGAARLAKGGSARVEEGSARVDGGLMVMGKPNPNCHVAVHVGEGSGFINPNPNVKDNLMAPLDPSLTKPNGELDGFMEDISSDDGMDDISCEIPRAKQRPATSVAAPVSSWAGIVRNPNVQQGCGKLSYVPPAMVDGKKVISLSSADFVEKINSCERMLVGSFVGKRLPYMYVKNVLKTLWKPKGEFEMITRGESLLIFKFALDEDRQTALEVGCTYIASRLFIIKPWKPFIEQELTTLKSIPIWVKLYNVPFQFWTTRGLSTLASYLGTPIMLDAPTLAERRLDFARVCVDVDLSCDFSSSFEVIVDESKSIQISVDYAWKPTKCGFCGVFVHSVSKCVMKPKVAKPAKMASGQNSTVAKLQPVHQRSAGVIQSFKGDGSEWRRVVKGKGVVISPNVPVGADDNVDRSNLQVQILRREGPVIRDPEVVPKKINPSSSSLHIVNSNGGNRFDVLRDGDQEDDSGELQVIKEVNKDVEMAGADEAASGGDFTSHELSYLAQSKKGTLPTC